MAEGGWDYMDHEHGWQLGGRSCIKVILIPSYSGKQNKTKNNNNKKRHNEVEGLRLISKIRPKKHQITT